MSSQAPESCDIIMVFLYMCLAYINIKHAYKNEWKDHEKVPFFVTLLEK